jgi:hypothetical protein
MMWNRAEAFLLIEAIEKRVAPIGYHTALGGSVSYQGWSDKDVDIIIYDRTANPFKRDLLDKELIGLGLTKDKVYPHPTYDREVEIWFLNGKRVDLLFLK